MGTLLFTPKKIGTLQLKNRIIMSAMHTGLSLEREKAFLAERAQGGAALVTAVMGVSLRAAAFDMPVICEASRAAITSMAAAVHAAGGRLSIQLFHAGRNCEEGRLADPLAHPVAPSPIPSPIYRAIPHQLTVAEIGEICHRFALAAVLCRECGADVLEISCSAGYLLSQFLSPLTNQRTDCYGGTPEKRARMPLTVIRLVRQAVGQDCPLILRISGADMLGGYGLPEMQQLVEWAEADIDAVSVTGGWHEAPVPQISMDLPEGGFAFLARAIRSITAKPVIACNRINTGACAERLLQENTCDFVGCARAFLTDPNFAVRAEEGKPYLKCIGCNKGCIENVLRHAPATCVFNPQVGHEGDLAPATVKKNILIVGGGPAGLTAARYLARQGHSVTLCERDGQWGGLLRIAGLPPHKETLRDNIAVLAAYAQEAGAQLYLHTEVDAAYLKDRHFDRILIAEGCKERIPPLENPTARRIYSAGEIFTASDRFLNQLADQHICIIGGGSAAAELAHFLFEKAAPKADQRAFLDLFASPEIHLTLCRSGTVTLIARGPKIARDLGSTRWILMKQLRQYPVELLTGSVVSRIDAAEVEIRQGDVTLTRPADVIITATGYESRAGALVQYLEQAQIPYETIGDCTLQGGGIQTATRTAWEAAVKNGGV